MEDVLEVYHCPYEDNEVLVCLDETSKQQSLPSATTGVKETRPPRPGRPGGGGRLRLRIRAQRREQSVHAVRAGGRVAAGRSHGPTHEI